MSIYIVTENKQINDIYNDELYPFENVFHPFLKLRGSIFQTKWHDSPLILTMWYCKIIFVSISRNNANLPETTLKIKFAKNIGINNFSKKELFIGKRVLDRK